MPRYLTYNDVKKQYAKHGCRLDLTEDQFKLNVTKNKVPYVCSNGHTIANLTKNTFNTRIRQGLGPCAKCSVKNRKYQRRERIESVLREKGCELLTLENRRLSYTCRCGKKCFSYDNNILKPDFIGCSDCANPFNNPEVQERIKETNMKRWGVENPFQATEVKKKIMKTCIEKYGVKNPMQNKEIFSRNMRSAYSTKTYTFPSGKQVIVQGYEPRCIDMLLEDYSEEQIVIGAEYMPVIWYLHPTKQRKARYYPDIFIPTANTLLEVKSLYTFNKELAKNKAKFRKVAEDGFILKLYVFGKEALLFSRIYHPNGSITHCPYPPAQLSFPD